MRLATTYGLFLNGLLQRGGRKGRLEVFLSSDELWTRVYFFGDGGLFWQNSADAAATDMGCASASVFHKDSTCRTSLQHL